MNGAFLVFFTLFWSGIVLMFDGEIARDVFRQFEARHYPVATGKVAHSEVKSSTGSKGGTSYSAVIEYRFMVGQRTFFGERLRYLNPPNGLDAANSLVSANPVGGTLPVFYNPSDPTDSLLLPGIDGRDLMLGVFLAPFNAIMLGFWLWIGGWLRERLFRPVAGGVKIIRCGTTIRVRLPAFSAAGWGLVATGGLGFVSTFVVGFSTGMQPSIGLVTVFIGVVYLGGAGVYLWRRWKIGTGFEDLVFNESARTLELPPTCGRKQRVTANIADIEGLTVEKIMHTTSKGGVSFSYAPTISLHGARVEKLADWRDRVKANDFADWLKKQLGL